MLGKLSNFSGPLTSFILQNNNLYGLMLYLDAGLTASYLGTGSYWFDISGKNNTFNLINSPIFQNNSLYFNSSYSQYASGNDIGTLNTFTIDTWFNLNSLPSTNLNPQIVTNVYTETTIYYTIGFLDNTNINGQAWDTKMYGGFFSSNWYYTGGFTLSLNYWYNVTLTYDTQNLNLYLNGYTYSTLSCNTPAISSGSGIYIGRRWDNAEYIDGYIPIVRIYDKVLSQTEILNNFNSINTRYSNGQVSRYFRLIITAAAGGSSPDSNCTQMSDFVLMYEGNILNWNIGATISNPDGVWNSSEGPSNLLDNNPTTKWCDQNFVNNGYLATLYIDNIIPISFDSYYYDTANDFSSRDPVSWTLSISNDNSTWTVVDTQTNVEITTDRETATQIFLIN